MTAEAVAYMVLVALLATTIWYARRARRAIDLVDEIDGLSERVTALERRQKLTQGRLNSIAPPREGTGGNGEDRPAAASVQRPMSRQEYLAYVKRLKEGR